MGEVLGNCFLLFPLIDFHGGIFLRIPIFLAKVAASIWLLPESGESRDATLLKLYLNKTPMPPNPGSYIRHTGAATGISA